MTPKALADYLAVLLQQNLTLSVMIWGPPGIGKSSVVAAVAREAGLEFVDLRLSQLAPTDLRGLPVADTDRSRWLPPEFLPSTGRGILFLDEINMAPPAMQGVAQQLILDRKVGSYQVPEGWFIWAAGNRKEDRAAVFDMPAPLANRFVHLEIETDFDSFKAWAMDNALHEQILAFLSYRKNLLHKIDKNQPNWPSPRAWAMASRLHEVGLDITPAVGKGPASEFMAFVALYDKMPDVEAILLGGKRVPAFPEEPSLRYAMVIALVMRLKTGEQGLKALTYMAANAPAEWVQLFASDAIPLLRKSGNLAKLAQLMKSEPALQDFMTRFKSMISN